MSFGKYRKVKVFYIPIEKTMTKIEKDIVTISYKTKFNDSARFTMSSLSSLVDNRDQM